MFQIELKNIERILADYHIDSSVGEFSELQRYDYERNDPDSKEVRLIIKVVPKSAPPLVIRFKNERDVTPGLLESQCRFAKILRDNCIETPEQFASDGVYARLYSIGGYDVIVTVEEFVENEIKCVDAFTAEKTGKLLARMHNISEKNDLHVDNRVLFDPFSENDLFSFGLFSSFGESLKGDDKSLYDEIMAKYREYMEILSPLKKRRRYAVQGDISDCNLYFANNEVGVFDFNRSGDNVLFCDAVMQAVFESRLMVYPTEREDGFEEKILTAFLSGYRSVREFSEEERALYPYLYAIINAFWSEDIYWNDDSLSNSLKNGDARRVSTHLRGILSRLVDIREIM